jgi:cytochrome P450
MVEERRRIGDMRDSLIDRILDGTIKSDVLLTNTQVNNTLLGTLHQAGSDTSAVGTLTSILFLAKHPQGRKDYLNGPMLKTYHTSTAS